MDPCYVSDVNKLGPEVELQRMSQDRLIYSPRRWDLEILQVVTPQRIYIQNNFPTVCLVSKAVCFEVLSFVFHVWGRGQ